MLVGVRVPTISPRATSEMASLLSRGSIGRIRASGEASEQAVLQVGTPGLLADGRRGPTPPCPPGRCNCALPAALRAAPGAAMQIMSYSIHGLHNPALTRVSDNSRPHPKRSFPRWSRREHASGAASATARTAFPRRWPPSWPSRPRAASCTTAASSSSRHTCAAK